MKIFYLLMFWCCCAGAAYGQTTFSAAWYGTWSGQMEIISPGRPKMMIPMSLEITPADSGWRYVITYNAGTDKPDRRDYQLRTVDAAKGHYAIDEKNGIILDAYLLDNCLFSHFSVMESDITSRVCLDEAGGVLHYEINSGKTEPVRVSGGNRHQGEEIPPVKSYGIFNVTRAVLRKGK